jgi:peptidoglycan/xylan/chitin deacetylase (PgdA/CDA1 family)
MTKIEIVDMNPVSAAINGKGYLNFLRRSVSIARHYGMTADKMNRALEQFATILHRFGCGATFPITAVALQRTPHVVREYQAQGIEFAIHGYRHLDHSQLSEEEQLAHLKLARQAFARAGIQAHGFRSPYLRWTPDTLVALRQQGLAYDSSQGLSWDVLDGSETPAYRHVLGFYGALSASEYPSLPSLEGNLIRIPYSLPDDEALVHRLSLETTDQMSALWLAILHRSYELGELFTLGLHPERMLICQDLLTAVLSEARQLDPPVWIARLDEISAWWQARIKTVVRTTDVTDSQLHLTVVGPSGTTVLARGVKVDASTTPWVNDYRRVETTTFAVHAPLRPFIGLSSACSPKLVSFLRQQGYIVEISEDKDLYACYLDQADFVAEQERPLLAQIEGTDHPLVRLSRWPNGAQSALSITGDIDALTLWDYGLRLLGK